MKKTWKDYSFVGIQFLLFALFVFSPDTYKFHSNSLLRIFGLLLTLAGFVIVFVSIFQLSNALSPYPSPKSGASLKTTGLYQYARHPIYTGILLAFLGWSLYDQELWKVVITLLLASLFYFKSSYEEERLIATHGEAYLQYKAVAGRFFPAFWKKS